MSNVAPMSKRRRSKPTAAPVADWRKDLATYNGRILGDERNVITALRVAPTLSGLLRFNEFAQRVEFTRAPPWREVKTGAAWTDEDDTALLAWLQSYDLAVRTRGTVAESVALVAREHVVHPVRAYLEGLTWDGEPRLQLWLADYLNANATPVYLAAIGRKFLVSAVARIMQPGCQVDHTLVLEAPQGAGKSRTARALAVHPEWFTDDMPDVHSKDAALQLCGRWIIELAELAALRRSEIEGMKAFLSRPTDVYRPPYARRALAVPRQSVFLATTNEALYLRDPTGNRRFWPVSCGTIELERLEADRDQLWAEAVTAYRAGETWHLSTEEATLATDEQRERVLVSELEADVTEYVAQVQSRGEREISVRELLTHALGLNPDQPDFAERAGRLGPQVAQALHRAGWAKVKTIGRGPTRRTLYAPVHRGS